ncbi:MAG: hypothetical protein KGY55_02675 [Candidatus Thermoplasmatota archaeon]|nr:hypothetical protein [Candidatus Thermoplasmatota archaeon]
MKQATMRRIVPLVAAGLLILGTAATIYVQSFQQQESTDTLAINGMDVTYEELADSYPEETITGYDDERYTGIAMTEVVAYAGVTEPAAHAYTFTGADGYSKQVEWKHVQNSVLSSQDNKRVIFTELPKQFWVADLIEIKVI